MTKIIAVLNQKGGVAKTTTCVNLGVALSQLGKHVLLIDLDQQSNLTASFGIDPVAGTMAEVMVGEKQIIQILTSVEDVLVAPASPYLADIEVEIASEISREAILKKRLVGLNYGYIFIDCPPSLSILTINALTACHEILIPMQMEVLALYGLRQVLNTIREVREKLNPDIKIRGIIPSMFDITRNLSKEVLDKITEVPVFKTHIRKCVKIAEAPSFAKSIFAYAPLSHGALDFKALAQEFLELEGEK